jgi:hypothetical protein
MWQGPHMHLRRNCFQLSTWSDCGAAAYFVSMCILWSFVNTCYSVACASSMTSAYTLDKPLCGV